MARKNIANIYDAPKSNTQFSEGHKSKGILDDFAVRKSLNSQEASFNKVELTASPTTFNIAKGNKVRWTADDTHDLLFELYEDATHYGYFGWDKDLDQMWVWSSQDVKLTADASADLIMSAGDGGITLTPESNILAIDGELKMKTHKISGVVDPTSDQEAATKKYVDDSAADTEKVKVDAGATGDYLGSAFNDGVLRTDGTIVTYTDGGDFVTLTVADKFLKNDAADAGVGLTLTGDNSSADTAYVPMVLYNTDATPPAASGFPIGTLYVQYTA